MASRLMASRMASSLASKTARPLASRAFIMAVPKRSLAELSTSPLQAAKRPRLVISTLRSKATQRAYSSEIADALVEVSRNIGMGAAAIGLTGAGIGIGLVFSSLLTAVSRNPALRGQLFTYAILGFAFVEAIGLFDLMIALMAKFT